MGKLYRLTAFPKTMNGGNKAGVYINGDDLSAEEMQAIAKKVNYSETAFVLKSEVADFKVRFFTPQSEVDLCGHATIATFNLLRDMDMVKLGICTQETKAGILKLLVNEKDVFMEQPKPLFGEFVDNDEIGDCFDGIVFHDILKAQVVSTGLREIFLPVKNLETLNNMKPDFFKIKSLSLKHDAIGIHAFCVDEAVDAYGRNFAPVVGINEESATGTSNGALGCYLYKHHNQKQEYILRQGYSMKQPSEIVTRLDIIAGEIDSVWVGGGARKIDENF